VKKIVFVVSGWKLFLKIEKCENLFFGEENA
jgi:hypothetical protein